MSKIAAVADLTPRQKDILAELNKGKTAVEASKALGISDNAVYQQIRQMREKGQEIPGATAKASGGKASAKKSGSKAAAKTGRKSSGSAAKPKAAPKAPAAPKAKPVTVKDMLKSEISELEAASKAEAAKIEDSRKAITASEAEIERIGVELKRRQDTLGVLTGEKRAQAVPVKPAEAKPAEAKPAATKPAAAKKASGGSTGGKSAPKAASGQQATAQPAANGDGEAKVAPITAASTNGNGGGDGETLTQAQREATAEHSGEAAPQA